MSRLEDFHVGKLRVGDNAHVVSEDCHGVNFTIGAEAADVIAVGIQAVDANGRDLAHACRLRAYLSSDSAGQVAEAASATLSNAAGTDGMLHELLTDVLYEFTTEADGDFDFDVTETAGNTVYLCVVLPNGRLAISDAITHAA